MSLKRITLLPQRRPIQLEMDALWEVAPGVKSGVKPSIVAPARVGVVHWEHVKDDLYRPLIETHPALVSLTDWDEKVYGCSQIVIRALMEAGFVEGERISPRIVSINLESFFNHRARMRANPWFWNDPDNLKIYNAAVNVVMYRKITESRKRHQSTETPSDVAPPLWSHTQTSGTPASDSTPSRDAARARQKKIQKPD